MRHFVPTRHARQHFLSLDRLASGQLGLVAFGADPVKVSQGDVICDPQYWWFGLWREEDSLRKAVSLIGR